MRLWTWFQCEFLDQSIVPDIKTAIAKGQGKIHRTLLWPTKIHRQIMVRFSIAIIICKLPPKIRKGLETIQIRRTITDRGVRRNTGKKLECCELVKLDICGTLIGFFSFRTSRTTPPPPNQTKNGIYEMYTNRAFQD